MKNLNSTNTYKLSDLNIINVNVYSNTFNKLNKFISNFLSFIKQEIYVGLDELKVNESGMFVIELQNGESNTEKIKTYVSNNYEKFEEYLNNGINVYDFENDIKFEIVMRLSSGLNLKHCQTEPFTVNEKHNLLIEFHYDNNFISKVKKMNHNALFEIESLIDDKNRIREYRDNLINSVGEKKIIETDPKDRNKNEELFFSHNRLSLFEKFLMLKYKFKTLVSRNLSLENENKLLRNELDEAKSNALDELNHALYLAKEEIKALKMSNRSIKNNFDNIKNRNQEISLDIRNHEHVKYLNRKIEYLKLAKLNSSILVIENLKLKNKIKELESINEKTSILI